MPSNANVVQFATSESRENQNQNIDATRVQSQCLSQTLPSSKNATPKRQQIRRRKNGSPITSIDPTMPVKTIYLIRHGQSQGQISKQMGLDRHTDARLLDCGLTDIGERQAVNVPSLVSPEELQSIELVLSSPLTRALHTALLAFPTKNIMVHFALREVGSKAPENVPRAMSQVLADLESVLKNRSPSVALDTATLQPQDWPRDYTPSVIKMDRIRHAFQWLYQDRKETVIAVVCHYNVIRSAVVDGETLRPRNGIPIRCKLYSNGDLVVDEYKDLVSTS